MLWSLISSKVIVVEDNTTDVNVGFKCSYRFRTIKTLTNICFHFKGTENRFLK